MIEITRRIEFDAGHRIPDHKSKCRNVHGHRYVLEATFCGEVQGSDAGSDHGMIKDFGDLKGMLNAAVGDVWDHAFLVYEHDDLMIAALGMLAHDHKTVFLPRVPTVENLAIIAAESILFLLGTNNVPIQLVHLRLYETPNCWADWRD